MFRKVENFFLNKFAGKLIARGAVLVAGLLVGQAASFQVSLDPAEVQAAVVLAFNSLFEYIKARRMANPTSAAVQTDANKPGGEVSAVALAK